MLRFTSIAELGEYWTPAFRQITSPGLPDATADTSAAAVLGVLVHVAAYAGLPKESTSVMVRAKAATNGTPRRRTPARLLISLCLLSSPHLDKERSGFATRFLRLAPRDPFLTSTPRFFGRFHRTVTTWRHNLRQTDIAVTNSLLDSRVLANRMT
jgi:hypothetical protein